MSGGVDSSLAAKLMKDNGFQCIGCTMKLYNNNYIQKIRKNQSSLGKNFMLPKQHGFADGSCAPFRCWLLPCLGAIISSRGATRLHGFGSPPTSFKLEKWPFRVGWGGYFFFVTLITPKTTTANRFSKESVSKTVMLSPPRMYVGGFAVPLLTWPYLIAYSLRMSNLPTIKI